MRSSKPRTQSFLIIIFSLLTLTISGEAFAGLVVIGNPSIQTSKLSKRELSGLFLNQPVKLPTKENLVPVAQPDGSDMSNQFYQNIVGWNATQVSNYWSQAIFSGTALQPMTVSDDQQAIQYVEQTPGAIAYVDSGSLSNVGDKIKVLYGNFVPSKNSRYVPPHSNPNSNSNNPDTFTSNYSGYDNDISRPASLTGYHSVYQSTQNNAVNPNNPANPNIPPNLTPEQMQQLNAYYSTIDQYASGDTSANVWQIISNQIQLSPDVNQPRVQQEIHFYLAHKNDLELMLKNATPYIYYIYRETQKRRMPVQFTLLPIVESGYDSYAYSRVGAGGLWQLMPETAKDYSLSMDWWYDSRRDLITSTNASLNFLVSLHGEFNSWNLAAASYNAGPGTVDHAIKINRSDNRQTDYWDLPLPKETEAYVPKLLALAAIIKNAQQYGVQLPYVAARPYFVAFNLKSQMTVEEASQLAGVPETVIVQLNTGMRRFATNLHGEYTMLIPALAANRFAENLNKLSGTTYTSWEYYQVPAGESLTTIASNYHTTVAELQMANNLTSDIVQPGKGILVPVALGQTYQPVTNMVQPTSSQQQLPQSVEFPPMPKVDTAVVMQLTANDLLAGNQAGTVAATQPQNTVAPAAPVQNNSKVAVNNDAPISKNDNLQILLAKIYGS